jgi:flagellar M-ring protein FliF
MVDNLKPDQVAKISQVVKDAIGIDETRGDSVTVASIPFNSSMIDQMRSEMAIRPAAVPRTSPAVNTSYLLYLSGAAMAILLIPLLVFMMRQRKVQTERSRLIMATGPGATASDISDLISDKIGRSTAPPETQVNTTDQLEKLAKEKPTKVAELLKSTWLAEKER